MKISQDLKEWAFILACIAGMLIAFAIVVAIVLGIPTALIVWIIETIKN